MRAPARGLTLLEVMIALAVFAVAALALASVMFSTSRLNEGNRENTLVQNAARAAMETMRNEEFAEIFKRFNDNPADDPEGPGTAPGRHFAIDANGRIVFPPLPNGFVAGLQAVEGDPDGFTGRIDFPTVVDQLREDFDEPELQMPRDLNADGVIDGADHAGDYRMLPVTVTVEWRSVGGTTRLVYRTVFVPK